MAFRGMHLLRHNRLILALLVVGSAIGVALLLLLLWSAVAKGKILGGLLLVGLLGWLFLSSLARPIKPD